jgi:hypothetical protein
VYLLSLADELSWRQKHALHHTAQVAQREHVVWLGRSGPQGVADLVVHLDRGTDKRTTHGLQGPREQYEKPKGYDTECHFT